jgi:transcriptional regulator with XRE-family HTH domain
MLGTVGGSDYPVALGVGSKQRKVCANVAKKAGSITRPRKANAHDEIGIRAKALRLHRRMTLDELAEQTGVSKGHLSRFERGHKSLSLAGLMRLSDALQSSVAELLGEPAAAGKSHLSKAAGRKFRKAAAADGGYAFASLSRSNDPLIDAFVIEFAGGSEMRRSAEAYHTGEEVFFVLEGAVEIELDSQKQILSKGDYLQFPGSIKHNIRSVRKRSKVLVAILNK